MGIAYHRYTVPLRNPYWDCCRESCPLFRVLSIARPAPRYTSPKWYTSPSPYRTYSSYSAEEKVLFLQRKKRLPVVVFRIYARSLKDQARKSKYPRT